MHSINLMFWTNFGACIALALGVLGVAIVQGVLTLREHAKFIAMGEIPKVEGENPDKTGEEKMNLVLDAIWARTGIPVPLLPALDFIFGHVAEEAAQYIFDKYYDTKKNA